jgi:hypothetical protein
MPLGSPGDRWHCLPHNHLGNRNNPVTKYWWISMYECLTYQIPHLVATGGHDGRIPHWQCNDLMWSGLSETTCGDHHRIIRVWASSNDSYTTHQQHHSGGRPHTVHGPTGGCRKGQPLGAGSGDLDGHLHKRSESNSVGAKTKLFSNVRGVPPLILDVRTYFRGCHTPLDRRRKKVLHDKTR